MSSRISWQAALLARLLALLGRLPLRALQALGGAAGAAMRLLRSRSARVAWRNLALCFPERPERERAALHRATLAGTGSTALESARLWTRAPADNLRLVRAVHGEQLLDAALAGGRGLIVAAPHLGNWELLNQYLASRTPITVVYRPPRRAVLEGILLAGRGAPGVTQVRAEAGAVRTLLRTLQRGGVLGILPDQQPKRGEGEFAPFFGVPALTMTLLPRLAGRTGATVLFAFAERLPRAAGFDIHVLPAPPGIDAADTAAATAALNRGVEDCVQRAPAQYQWSYKRFGIAPPGAPPRY